MTRSSSKLSLSLGGLGIGSGSGSGSSGRSRRGTDEGRKSWEDAEKAREKERGEERERELVERRISESGIVVSEVSAKDDDGAFISPPSLIHLLTGVRRYRGALLAYYETTGGAESENRE